MVSTLDNALHFATRSLQLCLILTVAAACVGKDDQRPSVLIVAADALPSELLTCSESQDSLKSISALCQESVRYTHAFSTSTLAVPALSSVLTAELPVSNGMLDNGPNFLKASWETAAEYAVGTGYKTLFISGGAPVLSRTGLSQGFEIFDDYIQFSVDRLYRPLVDSAKIFGNWLSTETKGIPFLAVVYSPEIQFIEVATRSEYRVTRDARFLSQMEAFDQGLGDIFADLKRQNRWESTVVILVGLSGLSPAERQDSLSGSNLYTENTQVVLMIKPAGIKRDLGLSWKVDQNVSLQDLGQTLFELLGKRRESTGDEVSLVESFTGPNNKIPSDRWLPTFDHWSKWRQVGPLRFSAVNGSTLLLFEDKIRTYNTLLDRTQISPGIISVVGEDLQPLLKKWTANESPSPHARDRKSVYRIIQGNLQNTSSEYFDSLVADPTALNWLSFIAMENRDWKSLEKLGAKSQNQLMTVTGKNLRIGFTKPWSSGDLKNSSDSCVRAVVDSLAKKPTQEGCRRSEINAFVRLIQGEQEAEGLGQISRFLNQLKLERKIIVTNYSIGYVWDGPDDSKLRPTDLELFLMWPQSQKIQQRLKREYGL